MLTIDKNSYEPAYLQLKKQIVSRIERFEFCPNTKIPPVHKLESLSGLSHATVAKAVNELIREGVLVSRGCKGTFVAEQRQSKPHRTDVIGITGQFMEKTCFSDPFFFPVVRAMAEVFRVYGRSLHFKQRAGEYAKTFSPDTVDGVIMLGPWSSVMSEVKALADRFPACLMIGDLSSESGLHFVSSANYQDTYDVIQRFIRLGRRRIAFIDSPLGSCTTHERWRAYRQALTDFNIALDEQLVWQHHDTTPASSPALAQRLAKAKPDAVFAAGTMEGTETVRALLDLGLQIPREVMIAVYDDFDKSLAACQVPYTVIQQPLDAIGEEAAKAIIRLIEDRSTSPIRIQLRSRIIEKGL